MACVKCLESRGRVLESLGGVRQGWKRIPERGNKCWHLKNKDKCVSDKRWWRKRTVSAGVNMNQTPRFIRANKDSTGGRLFFLTLAKRPLKYPYTIHTLMPNYRNQCASDVWRNSVSHCPWTIAKQWHLKIHVAKASQQLMSIVTGNGVMALRPN